MILIQDNGVIIADELDKSLILGSLLAATDVILDDMGCNDHERFHLMTGGILGGDRIHKIQEIPKLEDSVHDLFDEVWNAVEVIDNLVDTYPQRRGS